MLRFVLACALFLGCAPVVDRDLQLARCLRAAQGLAVAVDRGRDAEALFWLQALERALVAAGEAPADVLAALRRLSDPP